MRSKQAFVLLFVFFSCYLISSLSLVSAYQVGELQKAIFIVEPVLVIVDDLKPVNCESSGYLTFHAYVEDVPEFDIKGSEAFVEDILREETHNVTSSLSCYPKRNLISHQEITCTLKINELLSRIPSCPLGKTENSFYLTLEISYGGRDVKITSEKGFVLTEPGTEPDLEVNFHISYPPYPVPEINCKTGSKIDVPVVVHNAETLYGDVAWSFLVEETSYGGNLIECEKILSMEGEGREDIYLCTLVISSLAFAECEEGLDTWVWIRAKTTDHDLSGNFSTSLISQELYLGLSISGIEKLECQIVNEEGTCVPKEPQQNVTAIITGSVPQRLDVFETRYKLGEENITTAYCRRIRHNKYECTTFITIDQLPVPDDDHGRTTKSRELTVFFDVKYLNYYTNISDSTEVEMEGVVIDGLLNTLNAMDEEKSFFEDLKEAFDKYIIPVYNLVNLISSCCGMLDMFKQLKEAGLGEAVKNYMGRHIFGGATEIPGKIVNALVGNGPGLVSCIAGKSIELIEEEQKKLMDFEGGEITEEMEVPGILDAIAEFYPGCRAQNFWQGIVSEWNWKLILKCIGIFAGFAMIGVPPNALCNFMKSPGMAKIIGVVNKALSLISALALLNTYNMNIKSIAMARERINLEIAAANIVTEYTEKFAKTMESLATGMMTNVVFQNITYPSYDTIKLIFISDRTGVLDNEDDICTDDKITIVYNFEKLNHTGNFVSKLSIIPSRRGPLIFDTMEGTYGPYLTDTLLGTNPGPPDFHPSETYTFTLEYQNNELDYELHYVNHTCI